MQVIFNIFRQEPLNGLFPAAHQKGVGMLVRLPLASGLLTGKYTKDYVFPEDDHRRFNKNGEAFNVGETFAGLGFSIGVELSNQLRWIAEERPSMAGAAQRWILDHQEVSCIIPGFRNQKQVADNLMTLETIPFSQVEQKNIWQFYEEKVKHLIRGPY